MSAEKQPCPRKIRNAAENEARHQANIAGVNNNYISDATTERTKTRTDNKGGKYTVTVTKNVRPSKLLRTFKRAQARGGI